MNDKSTIKKLDDEGHLYYMDYAGDYYDPKLIREIREIVRARSGCSCFLTHNEWGDVITCRNYDLGHRVSESNPSFTGLNIILHCKPEGKYESIGVADAVWTDPFNPFYQTGGPEMDSFHPGLFVGLPYVCMDGINEKGLHASLLRTEIKKGDQPAQTGYAPGFIIRQLLDNSADAEEAICLVRSSELRPADWQDTHIFVTDAKGNSIVLESRNGQLSVKNSDIVTNFYVCSNDMEDSYSGGVLREKAVYMAEADGKKRYSIGYGHGYHRFVSIQSQLEMYRDSTAEAYRTVMQEEQALVVLRSVVQNPFTKAVGTSWTQYSAIYNNTERTVRVWSYQDYSRSYCYDVRGNIFQEL